MSEVDGTVVLMPCDIIGRSAVMCSRRSSLTVKKGKVSIIGARGVDAR